MPDLNLPEAVHSRVDDPSTAAVYSLELDTPPTWPHVVEQWHAKYEETPDWLREAWDSERILYVGAANDITERLERHAERDVRKAAIMAVYPPVEVAEIWPMPDMDRALVKESALALQIANENPNWYVHQR